jgi:hypothetical protein
MRMRTRAGLVLLVCAATAAGCSGGGGDDARVATADGGPASASASAGSDGVGGSGQDMALRFARCVRENGVPDFPDPKFNGNGGTSLNMPAGANKQTVDKAMAACKQFMPYGGEPPKLDPARLEQLRAYAKCMRANGVPDFPDPTEQGIQINGNTSALDPASPSMKAADQKCQKYAPAPPGDEGPRTSTNKG